MASFKENTVEIEKSHLKKWDEWKLKGDWQSYLSYLDKNNALSKNFIFEGGRYKLRPGYNPPWDYKDFK